MDLFTYLLAKNDKFSLAHKNDLFSYLLGKNNSIPLKTAEGVSITIEALKTKINELKMTKESTQDGEPTPDNPVPVEVVEGYTKDGNNYVDVKIVGNNQFDISGERENTAVGYYNYNNGVITITSATTNLYCYWKQIINVVNSNYKFMINLMEGEARILLRFFDENENILSNLSLNGWIWNSFYKGYYKDITSKGNNIYDLSISSNVAKCQIGFVPKTKDTSFKEILFGHGNLTSYEPYQESIVPIPLNGNFVGGIGDYKDTLIVDKFGKCYLDKVITKIDSYNGETITTEYMSTTGGLDIGATIYYVIPSQLIDLNYTVDLKLFKGENNISNSEDMMMTLKYY